MATDPFEPRQDRRGSILDTRETSVAAPGFDPSLDPTIRRLFEQQAEIQAKLAALLPARYMPSGRLELTMLRHKLRALETYARSRSMFPYSLCFLGYTDGCIVASFIFRFGSTNEGNPAKTCLVMFLFFAKLRKPGRSSIDANATRAT